MGTAGPSRRPSQCGRVTVGESRPFTSPAAPGLTVTRYIWHPPPGVAADLPAGFTLAVDAVAGRDGVRRFVPTDGANAFILEASVSGLALRAAREQLTPEQRFSYHAMRLVHQMGRRFREHLDRRFARRADLYVSRAGATGQDDRHILPDGLGVDARGGGVPWSPAELMARGAAAAGDRPATPAECIRLGLAEAARRNPLDPDRLTPDECAVLVRMALFDSGPCEGCLAADTVLLVQERLLAAVERHDRLDGPEFWAWLFGDLDNRVHGIAKRKSGGGRVARREVRQALLDLAFDSYRYVGDCVHVQMRALAAALTDPLTPAERARFDAMYAKQPYLGGLPLLRRRCRRLAEDRAMVLGAIGFRWAIRLEQ